jgi:HAD superfamily hydrolase (TIGR01459 family)
VTPTTLHDLAHRFDVFFIDQFGVLLDGTAAYPGAAEALKALATKGKRIVVLSNSGKRAEQNAQRLVRMGFDRSSFETVMSSGEAAHWDLAGRIGRSIVPGASVLILARDGDLSCIEGLDLVPTEDPAEAALVLISGSRGEDIPLGAYARMLANPARRGVTALCTNPDMTMLTEKGRFFGAGRIAALYRELGGQVEEIGKPHALIYEAASARVGHPGPNRVICMGDSPAHDVRGAHGAGYAAALVRTGIHADESLEELLAKAPPSDRPDFILQTFAW